MDSTTRQRFSSNYLPGYQLNSLRVIKRSGFLYVPTLLLWLTYVHIYTYLTIYLIVLVHPW